MISAGASPVCRCSLRCMRSTAPAIASEPPLMSASLVLVGKSTASPVGALRPAVPISRARSIRPKPGRIRPPRKRPLPSRASIVTAVPTITTSAGRGVPRASSRWRAPIMRDPAVDAEAVGMVVAVGHAAGRGRAHHPGRIHVPDLELRFGAAADALAGDDAAEHARRRRQLLPRGLGQVVDRLEEDRAVVDQAGARHGRGVQRPLEAGVADVDGEERHRRAQVNLPALGCTLQPLMRHDLSG